MKRRRSTAVSDMRLEWKREQIRCQLCEAKTCTDVHEIARGPHRQRCSYDRFCVLLLCRDCHNMVQPWPVVDQLALKWARDRDYFDPQIVNEIRGRAKHAITMDEIAQRVIALEL